jgi:uncharacterized 2Fe-2S/4Fe-4S cluster protein (DUF4445 family)
MTESQFSVLFIPHDREVFVLPGTKVLEAAAGAGLAIDTPCGGAGVCGKCRVRFTSAAPAPGETDRTFFSDSELDEGWRLACQACLNEKTTIYLPESSLFGAQHQILETSETDAFEAVQPEVRKEYIELTPPSLEDGRSDVARLEGRLGPLAIDTGLLRQLPARLRENGFRGTAVLSQGRLLDFEPGDTSAQGYGVAFDIGTTTLVASLLDLRSGEECAIVSRMNPQTAYGDDVISRIGYTSMHTTGLHDLQEAVIGEASRMIDSLCATAKIPRERIYEACFAGNTTMEHLLCGLDPSQLGQVPFTPVFNQGLSLPARDLGIDIHPRATAYVFPVIGGFVVGDTVAGMLAARLDSRDGPALMVDIGTNGEIVLAHDGRLWAASTAAGPAFEGARISCGMRATRGAIEKVLFEEDLQIAVIGNAPAMGLCGSALIDLGAILLDDGLLTPQGRLLPPEELPDTVPEALRSRVIRNGSDEVEFILAYPEPGRIDSPVTLNQQDLREFQLACGAIRAGINILLKRAGLQLQDLERVLIAGGFGSFIRRNHAQRTGLLPPEIHHSRIRYVGNTALSGARWALLSTESRTRAEILAREAEHVELSSDEDFPMEFALAMMFPEPGQCCGAERP